MPSNRLLVALGLVTLLVAFGVASPRLLAAAGLADALLLAAFLADLHLARTTPLLARRRWPPLLVQGAPTELAVHVVGEPGRPLRLREALHPGIAAAPARAEIVSASGEATWRTPLV